MTHLLPCISDHGGHVKIEELPSAYGRSHVTGKDIGYLNIEPVHLRWLSLFNPVVHSLCSESEQNVWMPPSSTSSLLSHGSASQ